MSASPVTVPIVPLPRDIDIRITIDRQSNEVATDMSLLVLCTPDAGNLPPNNGRVVVGSSADSLLDALTWLPENSGYFAVQALLGGTLPRPRRMAVGRVFTDPVPAQLMAAALDDFTATASITDGSFVVSVTDAAGTPAALSVEGISLTGVTNVTGVAAAVNAAIVAGSQDADLAASVDYGGRLVVTAKTGAAIGYAEAALAGTDISALLKMTQAAGAQKWDAYTPAGLVAEIRLIQDALAALDAPAFCVALDASYRDTPEQKAVADYAEQSNFTLAFVACSNSPTAKDSADTTNIIRYVHDKGYRATAAGYSFHPQEYPEIAYVRRSLATDYAGVNTVATAKFKEGNGITPESITETDLQTILASRGNVYTRTGRRNFFREGTQAADFWSTMSYFGWANLREHVSVSVMNGLARRANTPLAREGQEEVINDLAVALQRFVTNGFLKERDEPDPTLNVPYLTRRPYTINAAPIFESNRETGELSPIHVDAYEANSILKASININAIN